MTDPLDLAAIEGRAKRAHDWIQGDMGGFGGSLLPLSVRKHFEHDWPEVISRIGDLEAENDRLRARIAELEAEQQNGIWSTHVGHISRYGHFLPNPENPTHECRVWYGPVTPITDTGDQG